MNQKDFANILAWAQQSDSPLVQSVYEMYNQSDFEAFDPLRLTRDIAAELVGAVKLAHSDEANFHFGPPDKPCVVTRIPMPMLNSIFTAKTRRISARWTFESTAGLDTRNDIDKEIRDALDDEIKWETWAEQNWYGDAD